MKMATSLLYLWLLVCVFSIPSFACQPEFQSSYLLELDDGEHVFAMKSHPNTEFEYPMSGLYRKGPKKELVWAYDKWFMNEKKLNNSISYNGRYLVLTNYPHDKQTVYMSIYDNGIEVHKIGMEAFIDNPSQVYKPICSLPFWASNMQYDRLNDVVSVETKAHRIVSIHVPSGDVIEVERIRRMRIDGVITLISGSEHTVREIGSCDYKNSYVTMFNLRKEDGLTEAPVIFVHETGKYSEAFGKTYYVPDVFEVFLDKIESMQFEEVDKNGYYPVEVRLNDGSNRRWHLSSNSNICGRDDNGKILNFKASELASYFLVLSQPELLDPA